MKYLDVFIRADGGSSAISNVQYRGRAARGTRGVYIDFLDVGDTREEARARKRLRSARKDGWKPKVMDFITGQQLTNV